MGAAVIYNRRPVLVSVVGRLAASTLLLLLLLQPAAGNDFIEIDETAVLRHQVQILNAKVAALVSENSRQQAIIAVLAKRQAEADLPAIGIDPERAPDTTGTQGGG